MTFCQMNKKLTDLSNQLNESQKKNQDLQQRLNDAQQTQKNLEKELIQAQAIKIAQSTTNPSQMQEKLTQGREKKRVLLPQVVLNYFILFLAEERVLVLEDRLVKLVDIAKRDRNEKVALEKKVQELEKSGSVGNANAEQENDKLKKRIAKLESEIQFLQQSLVDQEAASQRQLAQLQER